MRQFLFFSLFACLIQTASAQWQKINDVDYVWGPFKIYTLSLFSESGEYHVGERPLMLSLTYAKPVEGRDFAISLARSWSNLGITLPDQDNVVDRLRKIMPNIKNGDVLSYIALPEYGYFVLNQQVIPAEFNRDFNDAVVAVWLDPRVEIGRKLLKQQSVHQVYTPTAVNSDEAKTSTAPEPAVSSPSTEPTTPVKPHDEENVPAVPPLKEEQTPAKDDPNPEREVLPPYDLSIPSFTQVVV